MRFLGFDFNLKRAPAAVSLADVLEMSQAMETRLTDLEAVTEANRRQIEAQRKQIYRTTDQREPLDAVASPAGQPQSVVPSNTRNTWRTGDPV